MLALSSAIKALVAVVEMLFSTKSVVTAVAQFCNPLYHAGRNNHPAVISVRGRKSVGIPRWIIIATVMTRLVQNAPS
jgi:hypothetical protein